MQFQEIGRTPAGPAGFAAAAIPDRSPGPGRKGIRPGAAVSKKGRNGERCAGDTRHAQRVALRAAGPEAGAVA